MKIAVLGSGNIGGVLGKKWAKAGHTIRYGVRDPQKPQVRELVNALGGDASAASISEAIDFGEAVLFAIPGTVMDDSIAAHAAALDGKLLMDAANKFSGASTHSMAAFAAHTPNAKVYRAFNMYGWENFENPTFANLTADLFYCGPDGDSRTAMESLITAVGLNPIYVGGVEKVDLIDNLLRLWFELNRGQKMGRGIAFKVLRR